MRQGQCRTVAQQNTAGSKGPRLEETMKKSRVNENLEPDMQAFWYHRRGHYLNGVCVFMPDCEFCTSLKETQESEEARGPQDDLEARRAATMSGVPDTPKSGVRVRPKSGIICPYCQYQGGAVTVKQIKVKRGISGGKATAAVFTAGISMLGTGLSRKQVVNELHCRNCGMTWHAE
jgi:hypothetical protein